MKTIRILITLDEEYKRKIDLIAEKEYTDRSKLIRRWIDNHYIENYEKLNEVVENEQKE